MVAHWMIQTETYTSERELALLQEICTLNKSLRLKEEQLLKQNFRLENIKDDDSQALFYTGLLKAFFEFLGPTVDNISYSSKGGKSKRLQPCLLPKKEMFLTLIPL